MNNRKINPTLGRVRPRHWALAGLCGGAFVIMAGLALNFWMAGKWYLADVGNIQYCLVNTWYGRFMWSPLAFSNHFGLHFTPFLLLLLPIVWLSAFPVPLVLAYQAALALTPVPVFLLARQRGLPPAVGLALGFWFLANHFTGSVQLANHFENFYVLFALSAMALLYSPGRHGWWVALVAALSVKEDAALWMLGFAIWAAVFEKAPEVRRRAVMSAMLCVVYGAVAAAVMALAARGQTMDSTAYLRRMGTFSVGADNLRVFLLLLASSGFLCLLRWRAALLLLLPVPVLLGAFPFTRTLLYYYSYPFLPFLAFATVAGTAQLFTALQRRLQAPAIPGVGVAGLLLVLGLIQYPLPTRTDSYKRLPLPVMPRDDFRFYVATEVLPRDVPLALQFGLWGQTPWRRDTVFLKDDQLQDHHYVFLDLRGIHGLSPEENNKVLLRLRNEVEAGRRRELFDEQDFLIISPATAVSGASPTTL